MLISCSRTAVERDTSTSPGCMVVNEPASFLADVGSSSVRFRSVSRAGSPFPLDMRLRLAGRAKWLYAVQHTLPLANPVLVDLGPGTILSSSVWRLSATLCRLLAT